MPQQRGDGDAVPAGTQGTQGCLQPLEQHAPHQPNAYHGPNEDEGGLRCLPLLPAGAGILTSSRGGAHQECTHQDDGNAMEGKDRASGYACASCKQSFTTAEGRALRRTEAERVRHELET